MIRYGTILRLGAGAHKGMAKVLFEEMGVSTDEAPAGLESPWLAVLQDLTLGARALRLPRVNTLVAVLMDEHWETGVVLGARYNAKDPAPAVPDTTDYIEYEDGTQIFYDPAAHLLKADVHGDVQVVATGDVLAQAGGTATLRAPGILLDGPVHMTDTLLVDGKVTASNDVAVAGAVDATGEITSGAIPLTTHKHDGVTPGGGTSGTPVP